MSDVVNAVASVEPAETGIVMDMTSSGTGILTVCNGKVIPKHTSPNWQLSVWIKCIDPSVLCSDDKNPAKEADVILAGNTITYELNNELEAKCNNNQTNSYNNRLCIRDYYINHATMEEDEDNTVHDFEGICAAVPCLPVSASSGKRSRLTLPSSILFDSFEPVNEQDGWLLYMNLPASRKMIGNRLMCGGHPLIGKKLEFAVENYHAEITKHTGENVNTDCPSGVLPKLLPAGNSHKFPDSPLLALGVRNRPLGNDYENYSIIAATDRTNPTIVELLPGEPLFLQHNAPYHMRNTYGIYDVWVRVIE